MVRQEERPWQGQTTVLLDTRAAAHAAASAPQPGTDPRDTSSFEWAVSAVASICSHAMSVGRGVGVVDRLTLAEPLRVAEPRALARRLADAGVESHGELAYLSAMLRTAAQESTLIAVLGRVDPDALRALLAARAGGHSSPAFALLLDVDTWSAGEPGSANAAVPLDAAAALRAAGWRTSVVRRGDTTAQAWQLLLAGYTLGTRSTVVLR